MKKFWKIYSIALTVLLILFLCGNWAYSAFQQQIDLGYEVEVIAPSGGQMAVFSDSACTIEMLKAGKFAGNRNDSFSQPIYVKNTGAIPLTSVTGSLTPATVSWGTVNLAGGQSTSLAVGSVKTMQFSLTISATAAGGNYTTGKITIIGTSP